MALADSLKSLQEIDWADLSLDNVGTWPMPVKVLSWALVFAAVCFLGYNQDIKGLIEQRDAVRGKEVDLKKNFELKAGQVANLEALKAQLAEMEMQFQGLLGQLPKDTEVASLIEDITEKGKDAGVAFSSIALQPERATDFYFELPIDVNVSGSYHDIGGFISGVAGMPRIVTLHDFSIAPGGSNTGELKMKILAKTYRYKGSE